MQNKKIKIGFFGNTCNNQYQTIKLLKSDDRFDLHLFIDNNSDSQQLPESDDPELKGNYPDWIHFGNYISIKSMLFPWNSLLTNEFKKCDIIIVSHFGPVFSNFSKKPTIFFPNGSDITVHPFAISFINLYYHTFKQKIGALFMSFWQRKGIRNSYEIWTQPFYQNLYGLNKLKVPKSKISEDHFPIIIDLKKNEMDAFELVEEARFLRSKYDFIIFHPSRIMLSENIKMKRTAMWKANDILIEAYKIFIENNPEIKAILILIDRPASYDKEKLRAIINNQGLNDKVIWLKPNNGFGYSRKELAGLYSISDVVADDFGIGGFGSIVVESLCFGINTLTYIDNDIAKKMYPWHPVLISKNPYEMSTILERLHYDKEFKTENASKGPGWVKEFHTGEYVKNQYIKRLLEIYEENYPLKNA